MKGITSLNGLPASEEKAEKLLKSTNKNWYESFYGPSKIGGLTCYSNGHDIAIQNFTGKSVSIDGLTTIESGESQIILELLEYEKGYIYRSHRDHVRRRWKLLYNNK